VARRVLRVIICAIIRNGEDHHENHRACSLAVRLYTRDHFGGPALSLHEAAPDLDQLGFNDRTSSVVVRSGTWEVCESVQYKGKCMVLEPGEYPLLKNFNDMMSSVREVPKKEPDGKQTQRQARAVPADKK
jgi:hypothetical protein